MTPSQSANASSGDANADEDVPRSNTPTPKRVFLAFLPMTVFAFLVAIDFPLCPAKSVFGVPCPGCGLTRATEAMMVGDVWTMLRMHPLAPFFAPLLAVTIGRAMLIYAGLVPRTVVDPMGKIPTWLSVLMLIALIGLWILRLLGYFGGHPDTFDPSGGLIGRALTFVWQLF